MLLYTIKTHLSRENIPDKDQRLEDVLDFSLEQHEIQSKADNFF